MAHADASNLDWLNAGDATSNGQIMLLPKC
jgi:hypothetical protein